MANSEELDNIEIVAREEVYPQRYHMEFPGQWPTTRHQQICRSVANRMIQDREGTAPPRTPWVREPRPEPQHLTPPEQDDSMSKLDENQT